MDTVLSRYNVQVSGTGGDWVVLGHGFGTNQTAWGKLLPWLEARFRVLTYDMIGAVPSNAHLFDVHTYNSLERFADDLLRVLAAAEVDRCHYVGHSIGAIIGMLASIARPEKFERLILIGASPCYLDRPGYKGGFTPETLNAMLDPITRNYQAWVEGLSQLAVGAGPDDPATMDFGRSLLAMRPEIALAVLNVVLRSDMRERLPEVKVPAVIVQTRDDPAVPMAVAEHLWDKLAGSVLEVIDAHGHLPHLSAPEKVVGVLEKHLPGLGHHR